MKALAASAWVERSRHGDRRVDIGVQFFGHRCPPARIRDDCSTSQISCSAMSPSPLHQRLAALALGADLGLDAMEIPGYSMQHVVDDARFHAAAGRDWSTSTVPPPSAPQPVWRAWRYRDAGAFPGHGQADIEHGRVSAGGTRVRRCCFRVHAVHERDGQPRSHRRSGSPVLMSLTILPMPSALTVTLTPVCLV